MRYKGGLTGGVWMTSLWSDLGNGTFDGANLVSGFEDLNPANTYWSKYYHLFTHIDTEEKRFLDFEKWWGGFFKMNAEEIHYIVNSLFVGNELEKGHLKLDDGRSINLKNFKAPIFAFASESDNITPPPQALNWIYKVYGSVDEIKRCGQVIIYMVHEKVGHLGIFVSSSVAKKEHHQILGSMGWIDYLAPGLYEMVIADASSATVPGQYDVRFEERKMEDILQFDDGLEDEVPFVAVNTLSRFNDTAYRLFVSPWVRAGMNEQSAEYLRQLHPLRMQHYMVSDANPFCRPLKWMAEQVVPERKIVEQNNLFVQLEEMFSDSLTSSLDYYKDMRDMAQVNLFKALYATPWMQSVFGVRDQAAGEEGKPNEEQLRKNNREKAELRKDAEKGGFVEASIRVMLVIAGANKNFDIREFQAAEDIIHESRRLSEITPEKYKQIVKEQTRILRGAQRNSLTKLKKMLATDEDRKKVYAIAERMAHIDTNLGERKKTTGNYTSDSF
jgi:hypothetical protein